MSELELSIVIPALNEERTIAHCVGKALKELASLKVVGEVVVADNGSTDRTREIAASLGARVVPVSGRGYGRALRGGFSAARGRFLLMGDVEAAGEAALAVGGVTVVKAAHHGSDTSSTPELVAKTAPRHVVFCVGRHNRFDFPRAEVVTTDEAAVDAARRLREGVRP